MVSIWNVFKSLAVWQIAVLAVVLFGAAGATYGGYVRSTAPRLVDLEENQQLIPVKYGDLVNEITTNGSLAFPNREPLSFGSPGTVIEILVEEGSPVTAGQVLAKLDATSVASLAQQVAQRELDLNNSTEILEETRAIDPLELAQKQEAVASARFQLKEAIDALEDAREPYTAQEIETQRQLVADTRLDLQSAERALAGSYREPLSFGSPGTVIEILVEEGSPVTAGQVLAKLDATSVASLAQQVAQRELDLNNSTEILEETRAIDPLELAQKQEAVASARFQLKEAIDALEDAREPYTAQEIETQRQLVADTRLDLQSAERALAALARDHAVQLAQAREAKSNADLTFDVSRQELSGFARDYTQQVAIARQVKASAELALDTAKESLADLPRIHTDDLAQARQDQADAQVALDLAQRGLAAYSPDYNLELAEAGEEAALAATALDQADQALVDFQRDYNTQLVQARLDEPVAQSELKAARDALEAYEKANTRGLEQVRPSETGSSRRSSGVGLGTTGLGGILT